MKLSGLPGNDRPQLYMCLSHLLGDFSQPPDLLLRKMHISLCGIYHLLVKLCNNIIRIQYRIQAEENDPAHLGRPVSEIIEQFLEAAGIPDA